MLERLEGYYCMDCMEGMKDIPDKYFELAIVVPPYGSESGIERTGGTWASKFGKTIKEWDIAPGPEYFQELQRVSQNQIIWGGNYFDLPPNRCFIIWRKAGIVESFTMSMAEYAWTSFNENAKVFEWRANGQEDRFHPTQKPVALYKWLLKNYAKEGDKILDTHVGSASSLIACEEMGHKYLGFEIDPEYYAKGVKRLEEFNAQLRMQL